MTDAEVLVAFSEESEAGEELIGKLPPWMPKSSDTGNFKLLDVVGRAIDRIDGDIDDIDHAINVQEAETVPQLEELAKLVDVPSKINEGTDEYRSRIIAKYQTSTTEATAKHILTNTATILGINQEKITYTKETEHGFITLGVPKKALDSLSIDNSDFRDIINRHSAAGFRIEATVSGTFTFLGESDYSGAYDSVNGGYSAADLNSDATIGHDGLDTNDDPKDNGGTYAGVIN